MLLTFGLGPGVKSSSFRGAKTSQHVCKAARDTEHPKGSSCIMLPNSRLERALSLAALHMRCLIAAADVAASGY